MRGLITFFVKYPIWANALILLTIGLGFVSYLNLNKSFFPELESRTVTIQVVYPGASPEEMEEGVVLKVEEGLKGLEGIEEVVSVSTENSATINVEIKKGYNITEKLTDVKNAVDRINSFPEDAEKPIIFLAKQAATAILLVMEGDVSLRKLKETAEHIEDDLLRTGFISQVQMKGIPDLEIAIEVREQDLLRYNLRFADIAQAIRINNRDISGGAIKTNEEEILIRSNAKEYEAAQIEHIILRTNQDGSIVRIKDVASVKEQFSETPNKTLYNGKNAISIDVQKLPEEDIIEITDYVKDYLEDFNAKNSAIQLSVLRDQSDFLKQRLNLLLENGTIGLIMVLITLSIFLSLRLSFWVAFAIPFCFLGMFFIGSLVGITINMISLFGMILVIGILVDDGIVVGENIFTHFERGKTRMQAAVDGTMEVIGPVFTSVFTTILAFCIIFFLEGRIGEFIAEMAVVVVASLAFSLVEAVIVLPSHLAYSKGLSNEEPGKIRATINKGIDFLRLKLYARLLKWCIDYKYITVAGMIAFIFITMGLLGGGFIQTTFFPPIDRDDIDIALVLPPGTREDITEGILADIEEKIWQVNTGLSKDRTDSLNVILATKIDVGQGGGETGGHTGSLNVRLLDGETRALTSFDITRALRDAIGIIPEADKFTIGTQQIFGKPVSVSLTSNNLNELYGAKEVLKNKLGEFPALKDVTDNDVLGRREIRITLKPEAYLLGFTQNDIAGQIRQGFFGEEVQRLQKGSDEVKIWVRYTKEDRKSIGQLENMRIKTPDGRDYPLSQLVSYEIERGVVTINHLNGGREVRVDADLENQQEPVPDILEKIEADILPNILAQYPTVRAEFKGQQEEGEKMQRSVALVGPIVLMMIVLLIALVFRSFSQAFMILSLIPIGFFCAVIGHGIEARPVSILSFYGIIALSGVVVNDAVVFLDKFNLLLKEGYKVKDAVFEAGLSRFRAIMLTSITTVAGLFPLIRETSVQAQFLIPMGISVAYGVLFGTFFILTYFPALILMVNGLRRTLYWVWHGRMPSAEEVEPAITDQKRLNELQ